MSPVLVATFYKFVDLPDYRDRQEPLLEFCLNLGLCGTILLAAEGINATVAGTPEAIESLMQQLRQAPPLTDLTYRTSTSAEPPFERMRVRIRPEIVTMGVQTIDPRQRVGTYIDPEDWNQILADPETLILDTRNHYEVKIGTFKGAVNPQLKKFREFPEYAKEQLDPQQHRKVAMFCTGGIRCEKASALLLEQGFAEVYHLRGGILNYLDRVPESNSQWQGECFVFDERVAVQHGLQPGHYEMCQACGHPIDETDKSSPLFVANVSCPYCVTS
ncbi:MAG: rhodanese-related sulfurtransferase [Cyanobacteria bacterium P01_H01_bin.121]